MRAQCFALGLVAATLVGEPAARAQWQLGEFDARGERGPPVDEATLARWRQTAEAEAWAPAARRSLPTLAVGVALVSVAAVTALVGGAVEAGSDSSGLTVGSEGSGARVSLGGAALASLAIPLIPFGAQRVGYPHNAPGLMYSGMALTFIGGAVGAASFATWAARIPRGPDGLPPALALAGAGSLALGIPFWAAGSRRPRDIPLEAPTPERPHASDALVAAGVTGLTLGVAGVLMGAALVWEDNDFLDPSALRACPVDGLQTSCRVSRHGDRVGEPMMIAGTVLASAGLVMIAFGAPGDSEPSARVGLNPAGLGVHGSF